MPIFIFLTLKPLFFSLAKPSIILFIFVISEFATICLAVLFIVVIKWLKATYYFISFSNFYFYFG
jgi:hypothetical protein